MPTPEELQAALDALTGEVGQTGTVEESAIALLTGLKTQLDAALAAGTPQEVIDQLTALSAQLDARQAALSTAISTNTPAAPPLPPDPPVP